MSMLIRYFKTISAKITHRRAELPNVWDNFRSISAKITYHRAKLSNVWDNFRITSAKITHRCAKLLVILAGLRTIFAKIIHHRVKLLVVLVSFEIADWLDKQRRAMMYRQRLLEATERVRVSEQSIRKRMNAQDGRTE